MNFTVSVLLALYPTRRKCKSTPAESIRSILQSILSSMNEYFLIFFYLGNRGLEFARHFTVRMD